MSGYRKKTFVGNSIPRYIEDSLSNSQGNIDEMWKVLTLSSSLLSVVDCSQAPLGCRLALNRQMCLSTENTCGACLSGYVGLAGDDNSKCFSSEEANRWEAVLRGQAILPCVDIHDPSYSCPVGWMRCNPVKLQCEFISKQCRHVSCHNHGQCGFVDIKSGRQVDACLMNNASCEARCSCRSGYTGRSCDVSDAESVNIASSAVLVLQGLNAVSSQFDLSPDSIMSLMRGIKAIGGHSDAVQRMIGSSGSSVGSAGQLLTGAVTAAVLMSSETKLPSVVIRGLLDVANSVAYLFGEDLSKTAGEKKLSRRRLVNGNLTAKQTQQQRYWRAIDETLVLIGKRLSQDMIPGENTMEYSNDDIRMVVTAHRTSISNANSKGYLGEVKFPLTDLERLSGSGLTPASFTVPNLKSVDRFISIAYTLRGLLSLQVSGPVSAFGSAPASVPVTSISAIGNSRRAGVMYNTSTESNSYPVIVSFVPAAAVGRGGGTLNSSQCTNNMGESTACTISIVLPFQREMFFPIPRNYSTMCYDRDYSRYEYTCPNRIDNKNISVSCNGSVYQVVSQCSMPYPVGECDSMSVATLVLASSLSTSYRRRSCRTMAIDSKSVTCQCFIPFTSNASRSYFQFQSLVKYRVRSNFYKENANIAVGNSAIIIPSIIVFGSLIVVGVSLALCTTVGFIFHHTSNPYRSKYPKIVPDQVNIEDEENDISNDN